MPIRGRNVTSLPLYALCTLIVSLWGNTKLKLWSFCLSCVFLLPLSSSQFPDWNTQFETGHHINIAEKEEKIPPTRSYVAGLFSRRHLLCTGTLIKENWVLTAAHCFPNEDTYVILGGTSRTKRERGKRVANITKIFSYPGFNLLTFEHDIMLLQIQVKGRLNQDRKAVPLPKISEDIKPGTQCLVIGWGTINQRIGFDILHEVDVIVIDRNVCNDNKHYHSHPIVTRNMLCAGDKAQKTDKCWGDSGSPLICNGQQRGITSFVKKCNDYRYPGVYTLLTKDHLSWIQTVTNP
ncbi:granzyme A-like [Sceloporus undulatus]|uniref:granzyme A-like n=1 Tax=Sceloporus undulatus TaxID=8520 RepID=UPI001C4CE805|nr:granzyme A-like [Sceloporus undulatus]